MLTKDYVLAVTEEKLSDSDYKKIDLSVAIIDNLLLLHGSADVWLKCTKNPLIKDYLAKGYKAAGWNVSYIQSASTGTYYIRVN